MTVTEDALEAARLRVVVALNDYAAALRGAVGARLGEGLVQTRAIKDRVEAIFAEGLQRFDTAGDYAKEGAIDLVAWVQSRCKVSAADAAQRVVVARQLEHLPKTQQAFAAGEIGLPQVAVMARAAQNIGPDIMQKAEGTLLGMAQNLGVGQFTGTVKSFEHQVDAQAALQQANRAYERRFLRLYERGDGMVQLDAMLDAEGGAIVRTALNRHMLPGNDDHRTPEQRRADGLVEICRGTGIRSGNGSGPRPQVIVRTTIETLAGCAGAPAAEIDGGGTVPAEAARRLACDSALTRIVGTGETQSEVSRSSRTVPAPMRRAITERDRGCVAEHCTRPPEWTDGHHIQHWADGGPTAKENVVLLCRIHHRMVHEGGYRLRRLTTGRYALLPPTPQSRSV